MNEVTRIHLGRQPFTISVDANHELKTYLHDIQKKVDQDVANEVEVRMSELLIERGISGEKVVIPEDIEYLKQQLGDPADFSEDEQPTATEHGQDKTDKRLFRNTDTALFAGVAAGLASYFGLDVVIVRLLFVVLTIFSGGLGIVIYILLWLVVPPAESASEKLQMEGKQVTLEALKDSVSKADVGGAARRFNTTVAPVINGFFRICAKLVGLGFVLAGVGLLALVGITKMYMQLHNGRLIQENLFPIGIREQWLLILVLVLLAIVAIFLVLVGVAVFKHKWPIRGWITGVLAGVFVLCSATSFALAADAAPRIHERYEESLHTTAVTNIQPFNKVVTDGSIDISYISSPNYAVNLHYWGNPDLSKIKTHVTDGTLYIDSRNLDGINHCTMLCIFPSYDMTVQVYAPNIRDFKTPPHTDIFYPAPPSLN